MPIDDPIRDAIRNSGQSIFRIAQRCEIDLRNLQAFMRGQKGLSRTALNSLASHFNLRLMPAVEPAATYSPLPA